jgi:hypothetical protein
MATVKNVTAHYRTSCWTALLERRPELAASQQRPLQLPLHARPRPRLQPRRPPTTSSTAAGRHRRLRQPQARRHAGRARGPRQGAALRSGPSARPAAPQQRRADLVGPPGRAAGRAGQHRHARRGFRGQALAGRTQSAAGSELRRAEGPVPRHRTVPQPRHGLGAAAGQTERRAAHRRRPDAGADAAGFVAESQGRPGPPRPAWSWRWSCSRRATRHARRRS